MYMDIWICVYGFIIKDYGPTSLTLTRYQRKAQEPSSCSVYRAGLQCVLKS